MICGIIVQRKSLDTETSSRSSRPEHNGFKPLDSALALQKRRFGDLVDRSGVVGEPLGEVRPPPSPRSDGERAGVRGLSPLPLPLIANPSSPIPNSSQTKPLTRPTQPVTVHP